MPTVRRDEERDNQPFTATRMSKRAMRHRPLILAVRSAERRNGIDIGKITPMTPDPDYVLGHSQRELQRLVLQAESWNDAHVGAPATLRHHHRHARARSRMRRG